MLRCGLRTLLQIHREKVLKHSALEGRRLVLWGKAATMIQVCYLPIHATALRLRRECRCVLPSSDCVAPPLCPAENVGGEAVTVGWRDSEVVRCRVTLVLPQPIHFVVHQVFARCTTICSSKGAHRPPSPQSSQGSSKNPEVGSSSPSMNFVVYHSWNCCNRWRNRLDRNGYTCLVSSTGLFVGTWNCWSDANGNSN